MTELIPAVRLDEICERYFGLSKRVAYEYAALNRLPVPTFRLNDSRKSPYMVRIEDLNQVINDASEAAKASWSKSQV